MKRNLIYTCHVWFSRTTASIYLVLQSNSTGAVPQIHLPTPRHFCALFWVELFVGTQTPDWDWLDPGRLIFKNYARKLNNTRNPPSFIYRHGVTVIRCELNNYHLLHQLKTNKKRNKTPESSDSFCRAVRPVTKVPFKRGLIRERPYNRA